MLNLGFRVWGLGFRVWGFGFGVWGLGFSVKRCLQFRPLSRVPLRARGASPLQSSHECCRKLSDSYRTLREYQGLQNSGTLSGFEFFRDPTVWGSPPYVAMAS